MTKTGTVTAAPVSDLANDLRDLILGLKEHGRKHESGLSDRPVCKARLELLRATLLAQSRAHLDKETTLLNIELFIAAVCGKHCPETSHVFDREFTRAVSAEYLLKCIVSVSSKSTCLLAKRPFDVSMEQLTRVLFDADPMFLNSIYGRLSGILREYPTKNAVSEFSINATSVAIVLGLAESSVTVPVANDPGLNLLPGVIYLIASGHRVHGLESLPEFMPCLKKFIDIYTVLTDRDVSLEYLVPFLRVLGECGSETVVDINHGVAFLRHFFKFDLNKRELIDPAVFAEVAKKLVNLGAFNGIWEVPGLELTTSFDSLIRTLIRARNPDLSMMRNICLELLLTARPMITASLLRDLIDKESGFIEDDRSWILLGEVVEMFFFSNPSDAQEFSRHLLDLMETADTPQRGSKRSRTSETGPGFHQELSDSLLDGMTNDKLPLVLRASCRILADMSDGRLRRWMFKKLDEYLASSSSRHLAVIPPLVTHLQGVFGLDFVIRSLKSLSKALLVALSNDIENFALIQLLLSMDETMSSLTSTLKQKIAKAIIHSGRLHHLIRSMSSKTAADSYFMNELGLQVISLLTNVELSEPTFESHAIDALGTLVERAQSSSMLPLADLAFEAALDTKLGCSKRAYLLRFASTVWRKSGDSEEFQSCGKGVEALLKSLEDDDIEVRMAAADAVDCLLALRSNGQPCFGCSMLKTHFSRLSASDVQRSELQFMDCLRTLIGQQPPGSIKLRAILIALGSIGCSRTLNGPSTDDITLNVIQLVLLNLATAWCSGNQNDRFTALQEIRRIALNNQRLGSDGLHAEEDSADLQILAEVGASALACWKLFRKLQEEFWPSLISMLLKASKGREVLACFVDDVFGYSDESSLRQFLDMILHLILPTFVRELDEAFLVEFVEIYQGKGSAVGKMLFTHYRHWITDVVVDLAKMNRVDKEEASAIGRRISRLTELLREAPTPTGRSKERAGGKEPALPATDIPDLVRVGMKSILSKLVLELVKRSNRGLDNDAEQALGVVACYYNKQEPTNAAVGKEMVCSLLQSEFMYLMTYLSEKFQESAEAHRSKDKRHILLCVARLVELVGRYRSMDDYVPKIFPLIGLALQEDPDTQIAACKALRCLGARISADAFAKYISSFVVALIPCLSAQDQPQRVQPPNPATSTSSSRSQATASTPLDAAVELIALLAGNEKANRPSIMKEMNELLPPHSALSSVLSNLNSRLGPLSHEDRLDTLRILLERDSADEIKLIALENLRSLLLIYSGTLHDRVLSKRPRAVTFLMRSLLKTARSVGSRQDSGSSRTVRLISLRCCECLGLLGAVDPSLLELDRLEGGDRDGNRRVTEAIDMSDKDFACAILSDHIVEALNTASDHEAHMHVGYCAQMLLRFLELSEDEFRTRFKVTKDGQHSADTLKTFRKTNYEVFKELAVQRLGRCGTTFFGPEVSFASSLGEWIAYLASKKANPQQEKILSPLSILKQSDGSTPLFLFVLPYAVQNVICSGSDADRESVRCEILGVLHEAISRRDDFIEAPDASGQARSELGRIQLSVQTIFVLLDVLHRWVMTCNLIARDRQSTRNPVKYAGSFPDKQRVATFLDSIPLPFLAEVSLKCNSPHRGLFYFERYLRRKHVSDTVGGGISPATFNGDEDVSFDRDDIELLHKIHAALEQDPDGLRGVVALRTSRCKDDALDVDGAANDRAGLYDGAHSQPRLMEQIHELESESRWDEALSCYEEALDVLQREKSQGMDELTLQEGQLRCLWRAGHLETLVSVCDGKVARRPELRPLVIPYALDALWRLGKWDELRTVTASLDSGQIWTSVLKKGSPDGISGDYTESLAGALLAVHDNTDMTPHLQRGRLRILELLSAASMESYERSYTLLIHLQALSEVEIGVTSNVGGNDKWWHDRLKMTTSNALLRSELLAVRRAVHRIAASREAGSAELSRDVFKLETQSWLTLAKTARQTGDLAACEWALLMLRNTLATSHATSASAVAWAGSWRLRIQKAELLKARGLLSDALQVLEPQNELLEVNRMEGENLANARAKALLLSTSILVDTGAIQGHTVLERYEKVLEWRPEWEKATYHYAKYLDSLLQSVIDAKLSNGPPDERIKVERDKLVARVLEMYGKTLRRGTKHLFEVLPRILTLWFSEAERNFDESRRSRPDLSPTTPGQHSASKKRPGSSGRDKDQVGTNLAANAILEALLRDLKAEIWYTAMPQLVSRLCHQDPRVWNITKRILIKIMSTFPSRALWQVAGLCHSGVPARKAKADELWDDFVSQGVVTPSNMIKGSKSVDPKLHQRLAQEYRLVSYDLVGALITLAKDKGQELAPTRADARRFFSNVTRSRDGDHFALAMPIQNLLSTTLAGDDTLPIVKAPGNHYETMESKEKPKKIWMIGTDNVARPFLCKHESKGDLRKDARMMEFNNVVNELFNRDVHARKRRLKLRTFAVVCLNESCGLLEWVQNTMKYRDTITTTYHSQGIQVIIKDARANLEIIQNDSSIETEGKLRRYRDEVLSKLPPIFHKFFLKEFPDPSAWLAARLEFGHSVAAWSMVGHIIGLGDRHADNILIDTTTGECIHVDFDCLFDKGLALQKPELVPFRLTRNMVDAFGVSGVEGMFRGSCEISLGVLRENKAILLSVLESFVVDPLVEWMRSAAVQNAGQNSQEIRERHKHEAQTKFDAIEERLLGIVRDREILAAQLRPSRVRDAMAAAARQTRRSITRPLAGMSEPALATLTAAGPRSVPESLELLPVSTKGQVDRLIREATDETKLMQMFSELIRAFYRYLNCKLTQRNSWLVAISLIDII